MVDDSAFEYGLFTCRKNIEFMGDLTADVSINYPVESLEEFFGSVGFLQSLNDGKSVDDILGSDCEKPIFMMNPLVLTFCLWLFSTSHFDVRRASRT